MLSAIKYAAGFLAVFVIVQICLKFFETQEGKPATIHIFPRAHVDWWMAVTTLQDQKGQAHVWTPYPPLFPLCMRAQYLALGADSNTLAKALFEADPKQADLAHLETVTSRMRISWAIGNLILLIAQAALIYALIHQSKSTSRQETALFSACGFLLLSCSYSSQIGVGPAGEILDYLAITLFLLGLLLLQRDRYSNWVVVTTVGVLLKVFPGLLVPVMWNRLGFSRRTFFLTLGVVFLTVLMCLPFLFADSEMFFSWVRFMGARTGWESVWAYPEKLWPFFPAPQDIPAELGVPFSPTSPTEHFGLKNSLIVVTILGILLVNFKLCSRPDDNEKLVKRALLYFVVLLFFSKGFSSYFILWLFPLLFVVYPPFIAATLMGAFLVCGNLEFVGGPPEWPWYWPGIFTRHLLLTGIGCSQLLALRSLREESC